TAGAMHNVVVVADRMFDEAGTVVGTSGYYIDLTDTIAESTQEVLDATLQELVEARALIEQAKGALMVVYRINANQAFQVLRWRSQETNTKLRALAAQLVAELGTIPVDSTAAQNRFDHLLLTVHERIPPEPPAPHAPTAHAPDRPHRVHARRPASQ
ncbi:ANTAR domain-containing protein, partial [Nocardia tengchongensis]